MELLQNIGIVVGFAGACVTFWEQWKSRKPRLRIVKISEFRGDTARGKCLLLLVRIVNMSRHSTYLLWETREFEVLHDGRWMKLESDEYPSNEALKTDYPEDVARHLGISQVRAFDRFCDLLIDYEKPLMGWAIAVLPPELHNAQNLSIRLRIQDCHGRKYREEIRSVDKRITRVPDAEAQPA
jgi:hypothetical protein